MASRRGKDYKKYLGKRATGKKSSVPRTTLVYQSFLSSAEASGPCVDGQFGANMNAGPSSTQLDEASDRPNSNESWTDDDSDCNDHSLEEPISSDDEDLSSYSIASARNSLGSASSVDNQSLTDDSNHTDSADENDNIRNPRDNMFNATGHDKIHPDLYCTKGQLLSLTLAFYLRHKITKTALHDLLGLLNVVVPNCVPTSKYYVDRYFFKESSKTETHFYCPNCESYLGFDKEAFACQLCDENPEITIKECLDKGTYFLVNPLKYQLKDFFENRNLAQLLDIQKTKILDRTVKSEVYTGDRYQDEKVKKFLNESRYNFTMTFSSDGLCPYDSNSSYSIWPITCSINELDSDVKSDFITICCLFGGNCKPPRDTFLKPFVEQTISLFYNGFSWTDSNGMVQISKVFFPLCVADAPARAMLCNLTQYNGDYGCGHCLHPGNRARQGQGTAQVYELDYPLPAKRDEDSMLQNASQAVELGKPVMGVKGSSMVYRIPLFDVARGFAPDYMHCLCLGIDNQFCKLWKSSKTSCYYIQNFGKQIDKVILSVRPPDDLPRIVRSYEKHGRDWKANEHKAFMFLISPVALKSLLPLRYYKHWLLLVNAGLLLLKSEVTDSDIENASLLIYKFVHDAKNLYGLRNMSYNLHLLTHVADFVRDWGAPWAYSAFMFEDVCGLLKQKFHGSRYILQQIFENFLTTGKLRVFARTFIDPFALNDNVTSLYNRLDPNLMKDAIRQTARTQIPKPLGHSQSGFNLAERYFISVELAIGYRLCRDCFKIFSYKRVVFKGKVYGTARYYANTVRDNSIVQLQSGEIFRIDFIVEVCRLCIEHHEEIPLSCHLTKRQLFPKGNIILIGTKLSLLSLHPCIEPHTNVDLTACLKK